jgi:hypothetical protein
MTCTWHSRVAPPLLLLLLLLLHHALLQVAEVASGCADAQSLLLLLLLLMMALPLNSYLVVHVLAHQAGRQLALVQQQLLPALLLQAAHHHDQHHHHQQQVSLLCWPLPALLVVAQGLLRRHTQLRCLSQHALAWLMIRCHCCCHGCGALVVDAPAAAWMQCALLVRSRPAQAAPAVLLLLLLQRYHHRGHC